MSSPQKNYIIFAVRLDLKAWIFVLQRITVGIFSNKKALTFLVES
ncbi:hypothetical protein QUB68_25005 [Microcoleus sp. A006_D1]